MKISLSRVGLDSPTHRVSRSTHVMAGHPLSTRAKHAVASPRGQRGRPITAPAFRNRYTSSTMLSAQICEATSRLPQR